MTQIVRAGEADVFHTRQQHTYKVAQVGRRLAQFCQQQQPELAKKLKIDPEVVEAACLAHDLGHPPFGHAGETVLCELVEEKSDQDGFEGNAQTFRVLVKLGIRFPDWNGLDLTRATLAACLKYPWLRDKDHKDRKLKWGAYRTDQAEFEFARAHLPGSNQAPEAALMDWADDIAYSVHDLEDFHRCHAVPWAEILDDPDGDLVVRTLNNWHGAPSNAEEYLQEAFGRLSETLTLAFGPTLLEPYEGTREQREVLRNLTSTLIGRYVTATRLADTESGLKRRLFKISLKRYTMRRIRGCRNSCPFACVTCGRFATGKRPDLRRIAFLA